MLIILFSLVRKSLEQKRLAIETDLLGLVPMNEIESHFGSDT